MSDVFRYSGGTRRKAEVIASEIRKDEDVVRRGDRGMTYVSYKRGPK